VETEDARTVVREDGSVFFVCEAVRVVAVGLELEQVDYIHESDFQEGQVLAQ